MSASGAEPPPRVHVLIVDDEAKTRESVAEGLGMESWTISTASTGTEALAKIECNQFDLAVVDWMLPDREGIEIVRLIRQRGLELPVLMLTARAARTDRMIGFEIGADDYLTKPFAFAELLARCRALLRRPRSVAGRLLSCGDLHLDRRARSVQRAGHGIQLTPQEVDLLEYLMCFEGQIVSREMLERDVWKRPTPTGSLDNVIEVQVSRLSRKVEEESAGVLIQTVRGVGYQLVRVSA